ncbi:YveK family protein [Paenibacillus validus]|uniref:YveK family protein n=1 Tax=Paenibacillus validus TaxID=44253 RepID=UPI003D275B14
MELELKDYFGIIKKRIWLMITLILVTSVATGLVSFFIINPVYEANTKLIINKGSDANNQLYLDPDSVRTNILLVNTYKEIIKSPAIMDKVVTNNPDLEMTSEELIKNVKVSSVNDTQIINVSIENNSQAKAIKIVNSISEVFKSEIHLIMKVDNVTVLNEAKANGELVPVRPKPVINIVIAIIVSFVISLGLIFLLDYLDDTIKTETDVNKILQIPVLATISKYSKNDFNKQNTDNQITKVGETKYASLGQ